MVGESGSGKSTLGKAIINLLDFEGSIKFNGKSIKDLSSAEKKLLKKDIQIVFSRSLWIPVTKNDSWRNHRRRLGYTF